MVEDMNGKNFIIGGVSRSGKSILSNRLSAGLGMSHIPGDALVSTLANVFPQCGITHFGPSFQGMCEKLMPFVLELAKQLEFENVLFVLDCYHILPESVAKEPIREHCEVAFLGYPTADPEQKLQDIRQHAHAPDWTLDIPDAEMRENIDKFIKESRFLQSECGRLGLTFVDTSQDFDARLDAALQKLTTIL